MVSLGMLKDKVKVGGKPREAARRQSLRCWSSRRKEIRRPSNRGLAGSVVGVRRSPWDMAGAIG